MRVETDKALLEAEDLLRRLSEWDVLNLSPGGHDDGPYWQREIERVRGLIAGVERIFGMRVENSNEKPRGEN